jgi:hypothetical protein
MTYLETTAQFYAEAAETPQVGLCCVSHPPLQLPLQCDKTAAKFALQFPQDVIVTDSTWHYHGGGCC